MSWFREWVPKRTLKGVFEPIRVQVFGRVAHQDELTSPITGEKGVLFQWTVGVYLRKAPWLTYAASYQPKMKELYRILGRVVWGGEPLIECDHGCVVVPTSELRLTAVRYYPKYRTIPREPPRQLADIVARLPRPSRAQVAELCLRQGDRIRLSARVSAADKKTGSAGAYRDKQTPFTHRAHSPAHIRDYSRLEYALKYL